MDFPSRLRAFDEHMQVSGMAERTRSDYRYRLVRFYADTATDPTSASLHEDDIVSYLVSLPPKGATRGMVLRALKCYCRWAHGRRGLGDPTVHLKIPHRTQAPAELIPTQAVRALLRAAFRREARRGWVLLLAAATGARIGSLVQIRAADVVDHSLHLRVAKAGRSYTVPLSRPALIATVHLGHLDGSGRLVGVTDERVRQWMREAARDAGVDDVLWHPHQLRHHFATRLARVTDPDTWRRLMGHADLSQYARYVARDDERLREAVEGM